MLPTLLQLGPLSISAYGVFLSIAFVVFSFLVWRSLRDAAIEDDKIFDNIIVVSILAFIGARLFFVATHWSLFSPNILYIFLIWQFPGLSAWGGLLLGTLMLYFYTLKQKISLSLITDSYAKAFPWAMFFLSVGIFLDGTIKGKETTWFIGLPAVGETGLRHPIGLYAAFGSLLIALGITVLQRLLQRKKIPRGTIAWVLLSLVGLLQLLLAFARQDLLYWQGFCIDYIIATVLFVTPWVPLWKLLDGRTYAQRAISDVKARLNKPKQTL